MKFVCLGYYDEKKWETIPESEQNAFMDDALAYDDVLQKGGHSIGGEALQPARNTKTLRFQNGRVVVTDGPYAETKEQVGGFFLLGGRPGARHPVGVGSSRFESRPLRDSPD
ncbi:MAG: YciI family protein [Vicinamibacteria bacterium]